MMNKLQIIDCWVARLRMLGVMMLIAGLVRLMSLSQFLGVFRHQMYSYCPMSDEHEIPIGVQYADMVDFARYLVAHSGKVIFDEIDAGQFNWDVACYCAWVGTLIVLLTSFYINLHKTPR